MRRICKQIAPPHSFVRVAPMVGNLWIGFPSRQQSEPTNGPSQGGQKRTGTRGRRFFSRS